MEEKTTTFETPITVNRKDLRNIGYRNYPYDNEEHVAIVCDGKTAAISEIIIRSCLRAIGDEYRITDTEDYCWKDKEGNETHDIEFQTNVPMALFDNL